LEQGLKIWISKEGRFVDFDELSVMSLYLPSGTNSARLGYKFLFMDDFQNYITDLKKEIPNLVICGDYNICHEAIDIPQSGSK
jgi:exodeoxyribonuclease-3